MVDAYQAALCPPGRLDKAVDLCRRAGVPVVLDETKTAGRVAPLGALRDLHALADYIVCGKAVANGVALSLLVGPADMPEVFGAARVSGTFSKDLMSVYAAVATREVFAEQGGYPRLAGIGAMVVDTVNDAAAEAGVAHVLSARTVLGGSLWELDWAEHVLGRHTAREAVRHHLADAGVLVLQGHPSFVMLAHGDLDFDALHRAVAGGLRGWWAQHGPQLGGKP